jgi:hypothetical protein
MLFPSVTIISDRRGPSALNAIRAHAVTYPAEAHSEDYAPRSVWGEHSFGETAKTHSKKKIGQQVLGERLTYITCQKRYLGPPH